MSIKESQLKINEEKNEIYISEEFYENDSTFIPHKKHQKNSPGKFVIYGIFKNLTEEENEKISVHVNKIVEKTSEITIVILDSEGEEVRREKTGLGNLKFK